MDRLTHWNGKKWVLPSTANGPGVWREITERLAAYENTGLEPEEIEAMKVEYGEPEGLTCDNCTDRGHCSESQSGALCAYER